MMTLPKDHGLRLNGVPKYYHKKVGPSEFRKLRGESGVSIRDFMFLSGRHSNTVAIFHGNGDQKGTAAQYPTMSDILILEVIKRYPEMHDILIGIANEYSLGPEIEAEKENHAGS